jgi:hypothetical protein
MATNRLFSDPAQVVFISNAFLYSRRTPFIVEQPVKIKSHAGTTLYGANHPGDASTTKFQSFKQRFSGNKAFVLPSTVTIPQNTTGGALSAANQLRVVVLVEDVPALRARGDQVAVAGQSIVAAGGGTAAGDATLSIKGTTPANLLVGSVLMSIASSGADTNTILVGDKLNVAGHTVDYFATATTTSLNGTTEVNVPITPPIQTAMVAAQVVTITSAGGASSRTLMLGTAPAVGAVVEALVLDATDVITETGGAMTAGRDYETRAKSVFYTVGDVNLTKAMGI